MNVDVVEIERKFIAFMAQYRTRPKILKIKKLAWGPKKLKQK